MKNCRVSEEEHIADSNFNYGHYAKCIYLTVSFDSFNSRLVGRSFCEH